MSDFLSFVERCLPPVLCSLFRDPRRPFRSAKKRLFTPDIAMDFENGANYFSKCDSSPPLTIASAPLKCCISKHLRLKKNSNFFTIRNADAVSRRWITMSSPLTIASHPQKRHTQNRLFVKILRFFHFGARGLRFEPRLTGRFSEVSDSRMVFRR